MPASRTPPISPGCSPRYSTAGPSLRYLRHTKSSASRLPTRCRISPSTWRSRCRSSAARFPPTSSAPTRRARRCAPRSARRPDLYVQQQCCGGLNFGYFYAASPVIAYDGAAHPVYSMGSFESSSVPGCRAPHFWLSDKRSLYDALGDGYGLIRFDRDVAVDGLVAAAKRRGVPFKVLHIDDAEAAALYAKKLVLVRPDR